MPGQGKALVFPILRDSPQVVTLFQTNFCH